VSNPGPRFSWLHEPLFHQQFGVSLLLSVRTSVNYLTDGTNLYEIAAQRTVQNFGRTRGVIRYVVIRDCATEMMATFDELNLAALTVVR
jgi:hypothetical protein